jgi:thiol-disulfide isomerase/thioredoxin
MAGFQKKLELAANVAIILVAVILGYVLVRQFVFPPAAAQPAPFKQPQVGAQIALPDTDFSANNKTLVMAIRKGCHFCSESALFYQKLAQVAPEKGVRLIAAFPHSVEEGQGYLTDLNVPVAEMKQVDFGSISVGGTPTLILIDKNGQIQKTWVGKLPPDKETEVINSLQ